jgi:hypothetical protein
MHAKFMMPTQKVRPKPFDVKTMTKAKNSNGTIHPQIPTNCWPMAAASSDGRKNGKHSHKIAIKTAEKRQNKPASVKPLFINAPTLWVTPDPFISAAITVMADKMTKKNAINKKNKFSVNPTDATAVGEIQLVATVATVTSARSLANVNISGQPRLKRVADSRK